MSDEELEAIYSITKATLIVLVLSMVFASLGAMLAGGGYECLAQFYSFFDLCRLHGLHCVNGRV